MRPFSFSILKRKIKLNIFRKASPFILILFLFIQLSVGLFYFPAHPAKASGNTYYVANAGNDSCNGTSQTIGSSGDCAWQTIAKVNGSSFSGDDQILFKRGDTWREQLVVPSSGTNGHPITFGAYGNSGDPKPIFMASAAKNSTGDWASNTTTVTYNISQTSDDKETIPSWSAIGDEESLGKRSDGPALRNGFRFQNAAIPKNATIASAFIKLYGSNQAPAWGDPESASPVNVRIKGQASDTTATFSTYADFAGRSETTAYVDWSNIPVFTNNIQFSSPDISSVVQETVNRSGWSSGNSMVIFLDDNGSTAGVIRDYKDYGEDSSRPASIMITYSDPSVNIWSTPISPNRDVGSILANNAVLTSKKSTSGALAAQGDFYYDSSAGYLYLYSDTNPATYYSGSIEAWYKGSAASDGNIVYVANKNYININNFDIKYGGGHGIQTSNVSNVTIENNTVSYVGGSYLTGTTRYGNGIELWGGASDVTVQNNSVSQAFDEGLTSQYDSAITQNNIIFQDNTVDKCGRGMAHSSFGAPGATLSNFYWRRNIFTDNGLGWAVPGISNGEGKGAQLNVSDTMTNANFTDNIIRNTASGADPNGQGILVTGGNWNVSRNWIENAHNSAIRAYGDPTLTIAYNVIVDPNTKPCMFFHGDGSNANPTAIYNNVCFASDNSNANLIVFGANGGYALTNHVFKNNIVLNTGTNTSALIYVSDSSSVTLDNNIYYRNSVGDLIRWSNATTYTQAQWTNYKTASSQDANSPTPADPIFTSTSNFHLQSTSPAINAGTPVGLIADYDNNPVPSGFLPDIGAYEYQEAQVPSNPAPPQDDNPTPVPILNTAPQTPPEYIPVLAIGNKKTYPLDSETSLSVKTGSLVFRGTINSLTNGRVELYQDGKLTKLAKLSKHKKWRIRTNEKSKNATHTYLFKYYDQTNQLVETSQIFTVIIDRENPKFTYLPKRINANPGDTISWQASDNDQIKYYQYTFRGKKVTTSDNFFTLPTSLPKGQSNLAVRAYDRAGNKAVRRVKVRVQ